MDTNKLTYIIVLNYNSSECTIQCLESLVKLINVKFKIVIVDNFSSDSSIVQIKKWIQNKSNIFFKIIENKFNYGYSKGNNIGISYALNQKDCENLWILNNDCVVYKNSLEELLTANLSSNSYNIWGSKILYENKKIQSLGCRINKYFMFSYHNYNNYHDKDTPFEIKSLDYIHGCSIFFNKSVVERIGFLPEEYFMFFEDVDYSINASRNKINLDICQTSKIIHKEGISVKKSNLEYLSVTNRIKFAKKYFPKRLFYVYLGICFKIIKSIFILRFHLVKNIILNLRK